MKTGLLLLLPSMPVFTWPTIMTSRLKLHEDWAATPAAIDACLHVADYYDIQAMIHTDTLNESGCLEQTVEAFDGRTIHAYHAEGAGGGHAPDIISICGEINVLPSSTNPTRPYTKNTVEEALDMLIICHHLDSRETQGRRVELQWLSATVDELEPTTHVFRRQGVVPLSTCSPPRKPTPALLEQRRKGRFRHPAPALHDQRDKDRFRNLAPALLDRSSSGG
ncbi:hypothetical protein HPB51_005482 [Rhipicephalus microplus]|uniref:Urease domain-containing protein n=1 Tax=Rhipicephalus microplus TaxID=6941 RepID=A0A9J6EYN8_RHIMP|nr:hypothetical protein HPB51_005482 [Rhipicephalus microplus]